MNNAEMTSAVLELTVWWRESDHKQGNKEVEIRTTTKAEQHYNEDWRGATLLSSGEPTRTNAGAWKQRLLLSKEGAIPLT